MSEKVTGGEMALAIFVTLFFTIVFGGLCFVPKIDLLPFPWFAIPLYLVLYPIIGKIWCELVCGLCWSIDKVYGFNSSQEWGNWSKGSKLAFSAGWPIAGPIGLIVTTISLLYGILFKTLFRI